MKSPTLFVKIVSAESVNPIQAVIKQVAFGTTVVNQLISDTDEEVDIAVTNSASIALGFLKETEKTVVVIMTLPGAQEEKVAESLASNRPDRIRVFGVLDFVANLLKTINEVGEKKQ